MKQALGLIETIGLVTAIEAADAAVKAANVILLGFENSKGGGKITIKFVGNVGAVQAAVAAGVAAASRIGEVYGQRVIPRPSEEIDALILNLDRGRGLDEPKADAPQVKEVASTPAPVETSEPKSEEVTCAATTKSGDPCKLPAQPGSSYCFVHRNQAED